ncbi:hypothetical protein SEA_MABODAMACA_30 [Microbacterium phage Mabodamaca]|uniref:Uncharacterized protein n=1 Tax=Microbacterium phage Mabodamaca TaxID=3078574 RepID=A0AA96NE04_9CAUD|nr:hypothetical protein SEA_MABODAMACA_30 [Microbacterium phage Mabodamaca]
MSGPVDLRPMTEQNVQPPYLTVIPYRYSARDKTHTGRGHALNAITQHVEPYYYSYEEPEKVTARAAGALYVWRNGGWVLVWSCQAGDDITGRPWKAAAKADAEAHK